MNIGDLQMILKLNADLTRAYDLLRRVSEDSQALDPTHRNLIHRRTALEVDSLVTTLDTAYGFGKSSG